MAENGPQINLANQGTLRHTIAVDDITGANKYCGISSIGGVDWEMCAVLIKNAADVKYLAVYLYCVTVKKHADAQVVASFVTRLLGVEPIEKHEESLMFDDKKPNWGRPDLVNWSDVINPAFGFVVDGRITIEMGVVVENAFMLPTIDATGMKMLDLDDASFADMRLKVKGEDWEGIRCHKAVMCRLSEAILGAMTNASTTEAKSGVFEIGDPFATKGGVEQFVRLNYEEWKEETMDCHVVELFVLGEVLLCQRVKVLATHAIKRLLSVATFWPTLKAAVHIDDKFAINLCVRFAEESVGRLGKLINSEEGKEIVDEKDKDGAKAFLVLMKEIGRRTGE